MSVADDYLDRLMGHLAALKHGDRAAAIRAAAEAVTQAARADRQLFVFGTGHSHMLAEEVLYRAGGLACAVPILSAATMLHEGAVSGSALERTGGLVAPIIGRYGLGKGDVLLVISNSGVNAAPLDAARIGRDAGATVVALTSLEYSTAAAKGGERLADLADIVIDNGIEAGDAITALPGTDLRAGPASTVVGAAILNAIVVEVADALARDGDPPVFRSANMDGAKENNARLVARYRDRNPHLR
ncbi:SIS domain-containing protein [Palleronia sp. LCG004]|uniref:SIS domain-containing protein n=1 Tax=Palleronia sp. LCG004 TaxID=3079304 RepID=UPI002943AE82|nr:SIS domain-containing protein [Palleronia sp. LCG004]WOI55857.1 SIS domain-containing protein [Palleronia sp. LCG004]